MSCMQVVWNHQILMLLNFYLPHHTYTTESSENTKEAELLKNSIIFCVCRLLFFTSFCNLQNRRIFGQVFVKGRAKNICAKVQLIILWRRRSYKHQCFNFALISTFRKLICCSLFFACLFLFRNGLSLGVPEAAARVGISKYLDLLRRVVDVVVKIQDETNQNFRCNPATYSAPEVFGVAILRIRIRSWFKFTAPVSWSSPILLQKMQSWSSFKKSSLTIKRLIPLQYNIAGIS